MRSCEYREVNQEVSFQKYRRVVLTTEQNHVASIGWILYDALSFLCIHKKDNASESPVEKLRWAFFIPLFFCIQVLSKFTFIGPR